MNPALDFYFDFSSPYAYFASLHIEKLAAQYGRSVNWQPILLGVVFKQTQAAPLTSIPLKGSYSVHDMARTARFHNMLFTMPEVFPISTQVAARAVLWSKRHDAARTASLIHTLYSAYFTENINISDTATVLRIAADVGLDHQALALALNQEAIKNELKTLVETAISRGVFGSPFVIVDGEAFWGFDRFDQLAALLQHGKI